MLEDLGKESLLIARDAEKCNPALSPGKGGPGFGESRAHLCHSKSAH